jgi:hypothetical protein
MADVQNIVAQKSAANTPAVISSATALASNAARGAWHIQNLGQNALYVRLGSGASTSVFHFVLKGGTSNDDGTAGSVGQASGIVYTGIITVDGTSPRYTVMEL